MNFDLISKIGKVGSDRFHAYIKSIASGDGHVMSRMASGSPGTLGPWDRISPELKTLARRIASELPDGWDDKTITDILLKEQGLNWTPDEET
jgi:hypothetical protein